MRRSIFRWIAPTIALGLSAPAGASVLSLTGSELSLGFGLFHLPPALGSLTVTQSPDPVGGILVSSGTGGFAQPAGIFPSTTVLPFVLFTGIPLISSMSISVNNAGGAFAAGGGVAGGFGGSGPLSGSQTVGLLGGLLNFVVPLSIIGGGGVFHVALANLMVTVTGATWTTGVAHITGITSTTPNGATVNTVTLTGYDNRSAGHNGTLMLVSPTRIASNASGRFPSFATQVLTFVPEPGSLLLLGTGFISLALFGRGRAKK